jgi:hypothetical protein
MAEVVVTRDILDRLDRKLEAFSWWLANDEPSGRQLPR